jgi:hypothetical protein
MSCPPQNKDGGESEFGNNVYLCSRNEMRCGKPQSRKDKFGDTTICEILTN